jgi:hypothetical protein
MNRFGCKYGMKTVAEEGSERHFCFVDADCPEHDHENEEFSRGLPQKTKDELLKLMTTIDPRITPLVASKHVCVCFKDILCI